MYACVYACMHVLKPKLACQHHEYRWVAVAGLGAVDVAKCHACHANSRGAHGAKREPSAPPEPAEPAQCHKCHACHAKWRSMSPAAQSDGWCRQVPRLPRKQPRRQWRQLGTKRATRASPVPEVPCLPPKVHGRCRQVPCLLHRSCVRVSCVRVSCVWASCVWVSCVWTSCVWGSCVCGQVVCEEVVCDQVVCEQVVCGQVVREQIVCGQVVCEQVVCGQVVCEEVVCGQVVCGSCAEEAGGRMRRRQVGVHNQKHEPRTKMRGTKTQISGTKFQHESAASGPSSGHPSNPLSMYEHLPSSRQSHSQNDPKTLQGHGRMSRPRPPWPLRWSAARPRRNGL